MFGLVELFRGRHLAHHRWLNADGDPAYKGSRSRGARNRVAASGAVQYVIDLIRDLSVSRPYGARSRVALGACLSLVAIVVWTVIGLPTMPLKLLALAAFNRLFPVAFRETLEHYSHPDDSAFGNEYRVLVPLFNLNRHIHHHEAPRCPWYLLEYRTDRPLGTRHYFTHWFKAHVTHEYVLMRPFRPRALRESGSSPSS
jgi:fatty acid desaturase